MTYKRPDCCLAQCKHEEECAIGKKCMGKYGYKVILMDDGPKVVPAVLQEEDRERVKRVKRIFKQAAEKRGKRLYG